MGMGRDGVTQRASPTGRALRGSDSPARRSVAEPPAVRPRARRPQPSPARALRSCAALGSGRRFRVLEEDVQMAASARPPAHPLLKSGTCVVIALGF